MLTQEEVKKYWNKSACNYSNSIKRELEDGSADVWKELILDNAPPNREKLDILDIGTGPGFFSIIMAQEGHRPVGIDGSPEMLKQANINAQLTGVDVEFRQMNVHELDFPDNTFDMVISRNVTWTLYDPRKAYEEWKRVLRPGGRILVFDASWYASLFDKERDDLLHKRIREYREIYGELPIKFSMNQREEYLRGVPLIGTERPLWDKAEFWRIRMGDIVSDDSFNDRINKNVFSKMVYSTSPMFMVRATKLTEEEEAEADIHEHWNGRAPLAGVDAVNEVTGKSESLYRYMKKLIPDEPCRILDAGCGAGGISAFLARDGHDVTGLDLAERMLDEVEYTFDKAGLGRPHTVKADLNRPLSLENGTFDCIILNEVLWTLMKPELAIGECRRLLKPGGILIIGDSNKYLQELSEESKKAYVERWKPVADDTSSLVYGCDCSKASYIDNIHKMLPLSYKKRPEWDVEELESMGFKLEGKISIEESDIRPERFLLKFKID